MKSIEWRNFGVELILRYCMEFHQRFLLHMEIEKLCPGRFHRHFILPEFNLTTSLACLTRKLGNLTLEIYYLLVHIGDYFCILILTDMSIIQKEGNN